MNKLANLVGVGGLILATMSSPQARSIYPASEFPGAISTVTGGVNIPLASVSGTPNDLVFASILGGQPLEFQFGDSDLIGGPSIQFKNGVFNGFFFGGDFSSNGRPLELSMRGWSIRGWSNKSYADLAASGYLNGGNNRLTNQASFSPAQQPPEITTVAEPATIALIVLGGIWGLIMARRRESSRA
jgi:hypothetical protein